MQEGVHNPRQVHNPSRGRPHIEARAYITPEPTCQGAKSKGTRAPNVV